MDSYSRYPWFQPVALSAAALMLRIQPPGAFLVRLSTQARGEAPLVLSHVVAAGNLDHTPLLRRPNGWQLKGSSTVYPNVLMLLNASFPHLRFDLYQPAELFTAFGSPHVSPPW